MEKSAAYQALDTEFVESLAATCGDDLITELIEIARGTVPQRLQQMEGEIAATDWEAVAASCHYLQSSAGNLGARNMRAAARGFEAEAVAGGLEEPRAVTLLANLRREYDEAMVALTTFWAAKE